jgi:ATP-dependent helicase YprA (DUF1998 family)
MESLTTRFSKEVFAPYRELLKAEYRFHPQFAHARQVWEEKLTMEELVNGPYLEKSQTYAPGESLNVLRLHARTKDTINKRLSGRSLYKHQTDALKLILSDQNAVVATGTSSGKTLCYQIPILDDLVRDPSPGLRAVIIYPLNALVNDQLSEWEEMLKEHPQITFARFTGQTPNNQKDYEAREKEAIGQQLADESLKDQEKQREIQRRLEERLKNAPPNRLNHREAIRETPPQILITNFSMLEYLMERPVDASIFYGARLKFLVLDEVHAYRGVQATEIAFLIRRLKDRLGLERLTCVATSATLGDPHDHSSTAKVRKFAADLFNEEFPAPNPIYGTPANPQLASPSFAPTAAQYISAAAVLRNGKPGEAQRTLSVTVQAESLADLLGHDENLYRLRKEILTSPIRLQDAARRLWPDDPQVEDGLQALLEIFASIKQADSREDLLPTRLHYFVRAQDGLHVCLHRQCPGRRDGRASYFVSRKSDSETPEGLCPHCWGANRRSLLVEVVTCRKCGYLFGALQDLGPRRAQNPEQTGDSPKPQFDSFSTELGWAADSFWSYFSVEDDLPYPPQPNADDEDEDQDDLFLSPAKLAWCVVCGKKKDNGAGDNCECEVPHLRPIAVFHRQCPHSGKSKDVENLYSQKKKALTACPNCGARNGSGLEPLRRFQESDDETGLAMALPLAHFQVSAQPDGSRPPRKLLCFTDHRQRAAAFPALLEEETFGHDLGRKIVEVVNDVGQPIELVQLGEKLAEIADPQSSNYDPDFFLPAARFPDEQLDARAKRNLWLAETFSYFGIPDSARESAEDLGLIAVEYKLRESEQQIFHSLLKAGTGASELSLSESTAALQTLLGFLRQRKVFTLPKGRVAPDDLAFGRVTADISCTLKREGNDRPGWLPKINLDGSYRDNFITDYLRRLFRLPPAETLKLAEDIWKFLTSQLLLIDPSNKWRWKLDHERLLVLKAAARRVCNRCGIVTAYAAKACCPRKGCVGSLEVQPFDPNRESIIARWVAGKGESKFTTLKSEEHTAQINKDLAKRIEDEFRAEGVNLLSSTTTFEMGINIGDLQKVLLRNAPPSSASYVQRVGRAGRGKDKNAVCVTLCRRTKYDGDAWRNPPMLMSGVVRTPTVFIENRIIAQRHFNAVAFARFLRIKVADEQLLGTELKQQTPLAAFLPPDSVANIPELWLPFGASKLNFVEWLEQQAESDIFQTQSGRSLLKATSDFGQTCNQTRTDYAKVLGEIADELSELMTERRRLFGQGGSTDDIDRAVKNLLSSDVIAVLAKRGFLPRYAFPLDVVPLEVGWSRWSRDTDVELSRDRAIAISEFAPGAQVIARKKVFTSAGLYVMGRTDRPDRKWYSRCPDCEQIRTSATQEPLLGSCAVCQKSLNPAQHIKPFVEPVAFSVRIDKKSAAGERHRRTSLIRQRQSLTHFIDSVADSDFQHFGLFQLALKESGKLFRYNLGPGNDGFMLCPVCGHSEPKRGFKSGKKHNRLRASSGSFECVNEHPWTKPLAYGHQFESFCLIARPTTTTVSIESLAFALRRGLCSVLEVETSDIGVSWRWLANRKQGAKNAEIILYDLTPGGAGFVREGLDNWPQVVAQAHRICTQCRCENACYDCLKDYSNQSYHERLQRQKVGELLAE